MSDGITEMIREAIERSIPDEDQVDEFLQPESSIDNLTESQIKIAKECDRIKAMLLEKNRKYGNSALSPVRIFSKSDPLEQLRVRIDDKLNRLMNAQTDDTEDTVFDLIGYLVLYRVSKN